VSGLRAYLGERLRGQDHVLDRAAAVFMRGELGLARPDRPRGAFLAVGPTGTGKTELVLLAAQYLLGEGRVRRFDLSEYQRADAVERLLGTGASDLGAIGHAAEDTLPCVWLFDELEKAHATVFDLFIQMLEPGHITLANGRKVALRNDYIAFTSNLGAAEAMRMARSSVATIEQSVLRRVAEALRPEIVARIPDKLVFTRLTPEAQREIATLHVASEVNRLKAAGFDLQVSREALEFLLREGFHPQVGARHLRQTIERHLQEAVLRSLVTTGTASGRLSIDQPRHMLRIGHLSAVQSHAPVASAGIMQLRAR
jgi:ATP-dependent Clp protease ATP-binding subunit ClpB